MRSLCVVARRDMDPATDVEPLPARAVLRCRHAHVSCRTRVRARAGLAWIPHLTWTRGLERAIVARAGGCRAAIRGAVGARALDARLISCLRGEGYVCRVEDLAPACTTQDCGTRGVTGHGSPNGGSVRAVPQAAAGWRGVLRVLWRCDDATTTCLSTLCDGRAARLRLLPALPRPTLRGWLTIVECSPRSRCSAPPSVRIAAHDILTASRRGQEELWDCCRGPSCGSAG